MEVRRDKKQMPRGLKGQASFLRGLRMTERVGHVSQAKILRSPIPVTPRAKAEGQALAIGGSAAEIK